MKNKLFFGLLIFSLALNLAVAGTVGWHIIAERNAVALSDTPTPSQEEMVQIRTALQKNLMGKLVGTRDQIVEKRIEILSLIAQNPGDLAAVEKSVNELNSLKSEIEKDAIAEISKTAAELPAQKRAVFLEMIKNRTCMGPGMGRGRGGRHCPMNR